MMNDKITVMVTGVGGGGHGEQILKALRLGDLKYKVVGADMSPHSKGLTEVDIPYLLPAATDPIYIDSLLSVCKKHNVQVLFHGSEAELKVMSQRRVDIEKEGVFLPINPAHVIATCMDKFETMNFLSRHNFFYPQTVLISSSSDLQQVDFLPAILKPSIGSGGSANVMLAQTSEELKLFGEYLLNIYPSFIVQEYVGKADSEFTVGVLCSMDGELINSIAIQRYILSSLSNRIKITNRTGKQEFGETLVVSSGISQGKIGKFPEVTEYCEQVALALGCRGVVNIQCRYVAGKVYIFEINPRFSGTTSLRAMVGYNEPDILIRHHLMGEKIEPNFTYKSGCIMRGLQETFIDSKIILNQVKS